MRERRQSGIGDCPREECCNHGHAVCVRDDTAEQSQGFERINFVQLIYNWNITLGERRELIITSNQKLTISPFLSGIHASKCDELCCRIRILQIGESCNLPSIQSRRRIDISQLKILFHN